MGWEDWELTPKGTLPDDDQEGAEEKDAAYEGPERCKEERRKSHDRRELIRFEKKSDRRSGKDRRITAGRWKFRDF